MEVTGQLHALTTLSLGNEPQYWLDRRLGGPQSHSRRGGEEKNSQLTDQEGAEENIWT